MLKLMGLLTKTATQKGKRLAGLSSVQPREEKVA